jgi:hypothetical protein
MQPNRTSAKRSFAETQLGRLLRVRLANHCAFPERADAPLCVVLHADGTYEAMRVDLRSDAFTPSIWHSEHSDLPSDMFDPLDVDYRVHIAPPEKEPRYGIYMVHNSDSNNTAAVNVPATRIIAQRHMMELSMRPTHSQALADWLRYVRALCPRGPVLFLRAVCVEITCSDTYPRRVCGGPVQVDLDAPMFREVYSMLMQTTPRVDALCQLPEFRTVESAAIALAFNSMTEESMAVVDAAYGAPMDLLKEKVVTGQLCRLLLGPEWVLARDLGAFAAHMKRAT